MKKTIILFFKNNDSFFKNSEFKATEMVRRLRSLALMLILVETDSFTMLSSPFSQIKKGTQSSHFQVAASSRKMYLHRGHIVGTSDQRNVAIRCSENDFEDYGYDGNSGNRTYFVPPKLRGLRPRGILLNVPIFLLPAI